MDRNNYEFMEKVNDNILLNRQALLNAKMVKVKELEQEANNNLMYSKFMLYMCIGFCVFLLVLTCITVVKVRSLI